MTCFVPPEPLIVPRSLALTPVPAAGAPFAVNGGHTVAQASEHIDIVVVSGTHRYSERPEASVRNVLPLLVRASTVEADVLCAAADVDEGADGAAAYEPPELQAAAKTPAAASGRPNLSANEIFLEVGKLVICCAFLSDWNRRA